MSPADWWGTDPHVLRDRLIARGSRIVQLEAMLVERWHEFGEGRSLQEWMGMTDEQYAKFVEDGGAATGGTP